MAKYKVIWSSAAQNDLYRILEFYNLRNKSSRYSKKLWIELNKSLAYLADNPLLGINTEEAEVRFIIKGKFELIYQIFEANKELLVIMVWPSEKNPASKKLDDRIKK